MPTSTKEKKERERRALSAARSAGVPIPLSEIPGEEPDFRFSTDAGPLGVEVSELMRTDKSNAGIAPAAEVSYHWEIIRTAQKKYEARHGRIAKVVLYFANVRGRKGDKKKMATALCEFVEANVHKANPVVNFGALDLPEGLGAMSISAEEGDWQCGESGDPTVSAVWDALASTIRKKDKLVPTYRKNLGQDSQVWLLLYTTASASRSLPLPHGIEERRFPFGFDRVFWFASFEREYVEILRSG